MTDNKNENNKQTMAFAVNYEGLPDKAPIVTAKGKGKLAEKILDIAFENGVKVRQDSDLVEILESIEVGVEVPLKALGAVTEILEYVYEVNERQKNK